MTIALTHFAGRAGDHNDRAMAASPLLAAAFAERLGVEATVIGRPEPADPGQWDTELRHAEPALREIAARFEAVLGSGSTAVTALSRCAVAIATVPVVARHRPDAVVVWLDAHADLQSPKTSETGFLGGLALSGPLGVWDSGFGGGLSPAHVILVGARDIDPPEQVFIDAHAIPVIAVGPDMADELRRTIAGRPVYVHLDCDVLDPGIVPTDYRVPGGMTLAQLEACAQALAESDVIGLEVAELEIGAPGDGQPARMLTAALSPLLSPSGP